MIHGVEEISLIASMDVFRHKYRPKKIFFRLLSINLSHPIVIYNRI